MTVWLLALASVILVSLISLVGIATLSASESRLRNAISILVGVAVGALLGDAFIHLIPESFKELGFTPRVPALILSGMAAFFVLEKILHWRHKHEVGESGHIHPSGPLNLVANGVHNFVDGILIGVAFLSSPSVGIATTVAIILHEIPQEFGNFAVLVHAGYSRRRALLFNFLAGCAAIIGAVVALVAGTSATQFSLWMLPVAAGGFIYIASCDLIPHLQRETNPARSLAQLMAIGFGCSLMFGLLLIGEQGGKP